MKWEELDSMIPKNFPQLREVYNDEMEWWGDEIPGSHNIYGSVFNPYLHECITDDRKVVEMQAAFDFIERVLELDDEHAENVMALTVLASVSYLFELQPGLNKYLGERSKVILNEIREFDRSGS